MRQYWFEVTPDGWHDVVAGLIREGQLELALERLETMQRDNIHIEDWLSDTVIYTLLDREEFDEALAFFKRRLTGGATIAANLWYQLLDRASRAFHVRGRPRGLGLTDRR